MPVGVLTIGRVIQARQAKEACRKSRGLQHTSAAGAFTAFLWQWGFARVHTGAGQWRAALGLEAASCARGTGGEWGQAAAGKSSNSSQVRRPACLGCEPHGSKRLPATTLGWVWIIGQQPILQKIYFQKHKVAIVIIAQIIFMEYRNGFCQSNNGLFWQKLSFGEGHWETRWWDK